MQNIKFMCMVDMLKMMSTGGYIPLSWYDRKYDRKTNVVYDDTQPNEDGSFKVVFELCIDENDNCEVLSYMDDYCQPDFHYEVTVDVCDYDSNLNCIRILTTKENEGQVAYFIQNGEWEAW